MSFVWLLVAMAPAAAAVVLLVSRAARRHALDLAAIAPVVAIIPWLLPERPAPLELEWLLLGTRLGLDATSEPFLLLTVLVWGAAGLYARGYLVGDERRVRYAVFHLLTLAGNLGAVLALDVASFYLGFALMSFAAFGIVVHAGTRLARRAGRVYIAMAVAGEAVLVVAFLLAVDAAGGLEIDLMPAAVAGSPSRDLVIGLLLAGFGIKVGALPLHVWLPLAHPVAPTPGSAILSGCLIKIGLLGWMRFLPLGEASLAGWGNLLIVVGLVATFVGVLIGLTERDPKVVLAYSSISQMGIINVAVGVGLADASAWAIAGPAALLYALHHGVAKGSLFLGVGVAEAWHGRLARIAVPAGLGLAALALAGAPLTSGAAAKLVLKDTGSLAPGALGGWLDVLLPLTAVTTTLLMARFGWTIHAVRGHAARESAHHGSQLAWPWLLAVGTVAVATWVAATAMDGLPSVEAAASLSALWDGAWPVVVGAALAMGGAIIVRRLRITVPVVAPGDLLVVLERAVRAAHLRPPHLPDPHDPVATLGSRWYGLFADDGARGRLARLEATITRWEVAALVAVALLGVLVIVAGVVA
jgi:formate hydrogenlyase subunit 3/multisubunit Na+/H+ antiporter MnhD subunit